MPVQEETICTSPYIAHDGECCMDVNENSMCDAQEEQEGFEKVEEKVIEPEAPVEEPAEMPAAEEPAKKTPAEEPVEVPAEPKRELPPTKMEELMEAYAQGVTGYSYRIGHDKWIIRGDKARVKLGEVVQLVNINHNGKHYSLFYIDNVYLEDRKATGYCEGTHDRYGRQCASLEIKDIPYELSYADYDDIRPADWLFDFYTKKPLRIEETQYYVKGRAATLIIWDEEGIETKIYFDDQTGLPLKVEQKQGTATDIYAYDDIAANTVREVDVIHRNVGEIGSEEAFQSNLP